MFGRAHIDDLSGFELATQLGLDSVGLPAVVVFSDLRGGFEVGFSLSLYPVLHTSNWTFLCQVLQSHNLVSATDFSRAVKRSLTREQKHEGIYYKHGAPMLLNQDF